MNLHFLQPKTQQIIQSQISFMSRITTRLT